MISDQRLAVRLTDIGEFVAEPGLWQIDQRGLRLPLARGAGNITSVVSQSCFGRHVARASSP